VTRRRLRGHEKMKRGKGGRTRLWEVGKEFWEKEESGTCLSFRNPATGAQRPVISYSGKVKRFYSRQKKKEPTRGGGKARL